MQQSRTKISSNHFSSLQLGLCCSGDILVLACCKKWSESIFWDYSADQNSEKRHKKTRQIIQRAFRNVLAKKWPKNWSELPKKYLRTKQMPFFGVFFFIRTSFLVQNIFIGCSDQKRCSDPQKRPKKAFFLVRRCFLGSSDQFFRNFLAIKKKNKT